ncbi:MAG: hypothetical protein R3247_07960 [Rhodothermales bacterium]|nr:hypothetical protein [Rhodothermales bacterium]
MSAAPPPPPSFEDLVETELGPERFRRSATPGENRRWLRRTDSDLVGLTLSGGGIRSATFNLGLLQGLSRLHLLDRLDYLATVSGGGYIGSFWTAWRHRHARHVAGNGHGAAPAEGRAAPPPFPATRPDPIEEAAATAAVRHLREFSNFLSPRLGLLTVDFGRIVVAALSTVLPGLLAALSLLAVALFLWIGLARVLMAGLPASLGSVVTFGLVTGLVMAGLEWAWRKRERQEAIPKMPYLRLGGAAFLASTGLWMLLAYAGVWTAPLDALARIYPAPLDPYLPVLWPGEAVPWYALLLPSAAWLGTAVLMVLGRWLSSRFHRDERRASIELRPAYDRATSRLLLLAAVWGLLTSIWCLSDAVATGSGLLSLGGLAGSAGASGGLFTLAQRMLGSQPNKPVSSGLVARLQPYIPQVLAYLTIVLMLLAMAVLMLHLQDATFVVLGQGVSGLTVLAAAAVLILALVLLLFNPNRVGLHSFYRARLARAYLGASNPHSWTHHSTEEHADDDLPLKDLRTARGPLHLVCCAANDLAPADPLPTLYRGAVSAVLSPVGFSVGDAWGPWQDPRLPSPSLGAAVTASGAALNTHMGAYSVRLGAAVVFLMTALNLRLGLWLPHPTRCTERRGLARALPGLPFFKEMLGLSRADGRDVFLSDGGHFENMALYELVRRHCRYIIVSDCGADPDVAFDDFGNAVRRIRADFGVEIDIDLAPLRPGADGLARQPMVAGDIHYPGGDRGVLLFFKPTLTGTEPPDVAQYKSRNAEFPHESTGDQFYDEAQWESYRRLGEHAAAAAFGSIVAGLDPHGPLFVAEVFARARRAWLAVPDGYENRLSAFASRVAELDQLMQKECETLYQQVYREIPELDALARARVPEPPAPPPTGESAPQRTVFRTGRWDVELTPAHAQRPAAPGGDGAARSLDPQDLAPSLRLIRRVLLLMEEVYLQENLAEHASHPLYLGLVNYFARWAYAPLFRMWWPLLKTLYPQEFTRFVETLYGLSGLPERSAAIRYIAAREGDAPTATGYAAACWTEERGGPPDSFISYDLLLPYDTDFPVQAALVRILLLRRTNAAAAEHIAVWDAADFYVPPGLWGIGIGSDFLRRMIRNEAALETLSHLVVRLVVPKGRDQAVDLQMYRTAGFVPAQLVPEAAGGPWALMHGTDVFLRFEALPLRTDPGEAETPIWMVRPLRDPSPVAPSVAPASP